MKFRALPLATLLCLYGALVIAATDEPVSSPTQVVEGYAELASGRIYYRDTGGGGDAVVFLHAGSGNSLLFENQIEPFVASGFRVIAYDRAGQGRSTRSGGTNGPKDTSTSQVPEIEQLMDSLKIARFHLVGVAAGGGVALKYALGHPTRIISLVIANSIGDVQDASYVEIGQRLRPPAFNQLPLEVRELGPSYRAAHPEGVQRWLNLSQTHAPIQPPALAPAAGTNGSAAKFPRSRSSPAPDRGQSVRDNDVPVTFARLESLSVPTLLLTGDADLYLPPSVLRLFKQHMPIAEVHVISESGHAAYWENPDEFNRRVLEFLRGHR
jgi:pimeloyl-ACP methyl ester carboxylesterase